MFQFLLRLRTRTEIRQRNRSFRARASDRDASIDRSRVNSVLKAIENALSATEQERSGLDRRVEDALARASVTIGNGIDEYLERDAIDSHYQDLFSAEISSGQRRLKELATMINHLKLLKATVLSSFPDSSTPSPKY
jgi:hypothetical protein